MISASSHLSPANEMLILDTRFLNSCLLWSEAVHTFYISPWRWMSIAHQGILFFDFWEIYAQWAHQQMFLTLEQTQKTPVQPNPQRQAQSGHVLVKLQMIICAHAERCKHTKACVSRVLWFHLKKSGSSYVVCSSWMALQPPTLSTDVKWQSNWTREMKSSMGVRPCSSPSFVVAWTLYMMISAHWDKAECRNFCPFGSLQMANAQPLERQSVS